MPTITLGSPVRGTDQQATNEPWGRPRECRYRVARRPVRRGSTWRRSVPSAGSRWLSS